MYKRVLIKLSGEALQGTLNYGIMPEMLESIARQIIDIHHLGVEVAVVIGGGNIFRGVAGSASGMDRSAADYMGMLATVINGVALQDAIESQGVQSRMQSALEIKEVAESYIRRRAIRHLEKKRIVIFVAGSGNPYFTTDTAAALRALEIEADVILKATQVDGVYDADPKKVPDAKMYERLTYLDILSQNLKVMDSTAISLCMDNDLPIQILNLHVDGNMQRAVCGERIGTFIAPKTISPPWE